MTFKEVSAMVAGIGYPSAYYQFPDNTGLQPPFICFFFAGNNDLIADDSNYQKIEHLIIELYTEHKDFEAEAAVESVLSSAGMVWDRDETAIESERMYEVIFEMDVVIKGETNGE